MVRIFEILENVLIHELSSFLTGLCTISLYRLFFESLLKIYINSNPCGVLLISAARSRYQLVGFVLIE